MRRIPITMLLGVCLVGVTPAQESAPGVVTGLVVDALADPVAGAAVEVKLFGEVLGSATTDARGAFRIDGLRLTPWYLAVEATSKGRTRAFDHVRLTASRPTGVAYIRLWDAGVLRGTVVDDAGKPVAGAWVSVGYDLSRVFGFYPADEVRTGADGRYVLAKAPRGHVDVRVLAPGYRPFHTDVLIRDEKEKAVRLKRGEGTTLLVTFEGLTPEQLKTARVRVIPYAPGGSVTLPSAFTSVKLDAKGRCAITSLPELEYLLNPVCAGVAFSPRSERIEKGRRKGTATFRVKPATSVTVRGTLRDRDGNALGGQHLVCRDHSGSGRARTTTDARGAFSVKVPMAAGGYARIRLVNSDWVTDQKPDDPLERDLDDLNEHVFKADPGQPVEVFAIEESRVTGTITDARGRPIPFADLELQHDRPHTNPRWGTFARTTADAHGRFRFEGLHAADAKVRVHSAGRTGLAISGSFRLEVGKDVTQKLVAQKPCIIEGTVKGYDGQPLPGVRVQLLDWDLQRNEQSGGNLVEVLTDRNGRYRFIGVPPGGHYLQLSYEGPVPIDEGGVRPFEIKPGVRATFDYEL